MIKTVELSDNKLKIKFKQMEREYFFELLSKVKNLQGTGRESKAIFLPNTKIWEALPTKNNIEILKYNEFDFVGEAKKLLNMEIAIKTVLYIFNEKIMVKADPDILYMIRREFCCDDYSYCYVGGRFDINRVVKKYYFEIINEYGQCDIGFYSELKKWFDEAGYEYEIKDNRQLQEFNFTDEQVKNCLHYLTLYDYQVEAVQTDLKNPNGIIKLPTSAGKTEIFLALCRLTNLKTLILFCRIDLAHQTLQRAKKADLDCGIVQGQNIDENHQVIMTTVQSTHKLQGEYDVVIIDECHRSGAVSYQKILKKQQFKYRWGFSATPLEDGAKNESKNIEVKRYIGDIEYTLPAGVLMDENKIARPRIKFIDIEGPDFNGAYFESWHEIEYECIVVNNYRNQVIIDLCKKLKNVLVLVKKIEHGKILEENIPNSVFLYGGTKVEDREKAVKDFLVGKDIVLIASTIFDEGISINSIHNLIIAGGGASYKKTIQRLGRGLRIDEGKDTVNAFDFYDRTHKILERHSKKRLSDYEKEGFEVVDE